MSDARSNIFSRLRTGQPDLPENGAATRIPAPQWSERERLERFRGRLESVRAEIHFASSPEWPALLQRLVEQKQLTELLYAPDGPLGETLSQLWPEQDRSPLISRTDAIETWKEELFFGVDGAITSIRWGIAETGTLVLWPTPQEPRSFSLVPPVHIAILEARNIHNTFAELIEMEQWQQGMPTNALLISGPSKTADIEQTLAYGVHGPIELIVIVITDGD